MQASHAYTPWRSFQARFQQLAAADPTLEFLEATQVDWWPRNPFSAALGTAFWFTDGPNQREETYRQQVHAPEDIAVGYSETPYLILGKLRREFRALCKSAGREAIRQGVLDPIDEGYEPDRVFLRHIAESFTPSTSLYDNQAIAYTDAAQLAALICAAFVAVDPSAAQSPNEEGNHAFASPEPPHSTKPDHPWQQYVTIKQISALSGISERRLRYKLPPADNTKPRAHEWIWDRVRLLLEQESGRNLPEAFPSLIPRS